MTPGVYHKYTAKSENASLFFDNWIRELTLWLGSFNWLTHSSILLMSSELLELSLESSNIDNSLETVLLPVTLKLLTLFIALIVFMLFVSFSLSRDI